MEEVKRAEKEEEGMLTGFRSYPGCGLYTSLLVLQHRSDFKCSSIYLWQLNHANTYQPLSKGGSPTYRSFSAPHSVIIWDLPGTLRNQFYWKQPLPKFGPQPYKIYKTWMQLYGLPHHLFPICSVNSSKPKMLLALLLIDISLCRRQKATLGFQGQTTMWHTNGYILGQHTH